jgi:hypothetical protein
LGEIPAWPGLNKFFNLGGFYEKKKGRIFGFTTDYCGFVLL